MSVYKVTPNDVESLTLITTPRRLYSSGSDGSVGSIKVYPRASSAEKDTTSPLIFNDSVKGAVLDGNFSTALATITTAVRSKRNSNGSGNVSVTNELTSYLDLVQATSQRRNTVLDIERLTPTTRVTRNTLIKNNVKEVLMRHYRSNYSLAHWAYTNYNTVNFFVSHDTDGYIPGNTALLYPNASIPEISHPAGYASGSYSLSGAFSFDFYINPRYKDTTAGTLLHLSSSYAVSMVTGSLKDENGYPKCFRLQLQLGHSANYPPSTIVSGPKPYDLVFLSDDNSLTHNNWHHAIIRWGTSAINNGTGSFIIDGVERGIFVVPSGTIAPYIEGSSLLNPDVLCVGNFYEGANFGTDAQSIFFGERSSRRDGTTKLTVEDTQDLPDDFLFNHPLKAEVHDLIIKRYYMTDSEISKMGGIGLGSAAFDRSKIAFYLPPFFVEGSPIRRYVGEHGGIPQTPFFEIDGTTDDPFNVAMAFGVNGHYINLENFTKDFATGRFPRLLNLTASMIEHTTDASEANKFLYDDGYVAKRNLTILPCDDGNFTPNYEPLKFEQLRNKYADPNGVEDYSFINLDNLVFDPTVARLNSDASDDYVAQQVGSTPENPGKRPGPAYAAYATSVSSELTSTTDDMYFNRGVQAGAPLTIYQRTGDPSSNQVTIFNISNLYYGRRIQPGSLILSNAGISGSAGSVNITLRDDGWGNIYRGDSVTPHSTQNSVGNIFYDEGIIIIKSPHLYFFGKNNFQISFKGVQHIYSQKYEILATSAHLNSSSNPTYTQNSAQLRASSNVIDNEPFVYISGLNLHDENMNILAKARLAQPIIKREGDSILFKVVFDF